MVSELHGFNSAAHSPAPIVHTQVAPAHSTQTADAPKVVARKPVELNYDPAKAQQQLHEAVGTLNDQMEASKTGLGFQIDKSVGGPIVTVRSSQTGEVIRQIPNETVVKLSHTIDNLRGALVNKNA